MGRREASLNVRVWWIDGLWPEFYLVIWESALAPGRHVSDALAVPSVDGLVKLDLKHPYFASVVQGLSKLALIRHPCGLADGELRVRCGVKPVGDEPCRSMGGWPLAARG